MLDELDRVPSPVGDEPCVLIPVSRSLTTVQPIFSFGDFVPLAKCFQSEPGITHYGQIVGIMLELTPEHPNEGEWSYMVMAPDYHPMALDLDTVLESDLVERISYGARNCG